MYSFLYRPLTFSPPRMSKEIFFSTNGDRGEYCKLTLLARIEPDEGQVSGGPWPGLDSRAASMGRRVYWRTLSTAIIWKLHTSSRCGDSSCKRGIHVLKNVVCIKKVTLLNTFRGARPFTRM